MPIEKHPLETLTMAIFGNTAFLVEPTIALVIRRLRGSPNIVEIVNRIAKARHDGAPGTILVVSDVHGIAGLLKGGYFGRADLLTPDSICDARKLPGIDDIRNHLALLGIAIGIGTAFVDANATVIRFRASLRHVGHIAEKPRVSKETSFGQKKGTFFCPPCPEGGPVPAASQRQGITEDSIL